MLCFRRVFIKDVVLVVRFPIQSFNYYYNIHSLSGGIPLRHLVYRVLDLPQSMRPLVYDFGQLKSGTEFQYIFQVVSNHVNEP